MRPIVAILVLAAAGVIGWLVWQQNRALPLVVSGFVEADEIRVGSRVGGRVAEVLVAEGASVKRGEALFKIDPFDLQERSAEAKATLAARQAELTRLKSGFRKEEVEQARAKREQLLATLTKLEAGPRAQEIAVARERLKQSQANLAFAESEHARLQTLREQNQAAAQRELDEAGRVLKVAQAEVGAAQQEISLLEEGTRKEDVATAKAALAEASEQLKLRETGYRAEDIARAEAEVAAAQARVATFEKQLEELTVSSPCDCVVEAIDLQPGDLVGQNAPSVSLLDLSKLWVRTYVPEGRLGELSLGDRVPVLLDSAPGERLTGRVVFIAKEGEFTPRNIQTLEERSKQVFRIKVMLEEGLEKARVGVAADVMLAERLTAASGARR